MKVWSDLVHDDAIGKTAGTFDSINTNQASIKISHPTAKTVLGFMANYCLSVVTDAEIVPDAILRVNSQALGISNQDIVLPLGSNDGDAASGYVPNKTIFIPFQVPANKPLFNADFSFSISASVTNTGGLSVVVAVIYADEEPDSKFALELMAQLHGRISGGNYAVDAAKAHATGGTAVPLTAIALSAGYTELRGILAKINPNGITASDPISGFMEFQSSGIPDFSPQLWPLSVFYNPALGTVTDGLNSRGEGRYYPTRFPLTGAAISINVNSTLLVAAATAPDTVQAVVFN